MTIRTPDDEITTPGYFLPPFKAGLTYQGVTYAGHSDFAVDFNRRNVTPGGDVEWVADAGDPVLAIAGGKVIEAVEARKGRHRWRVTVKTPVQLPAAIAEESIWLSGGGRTGALVRLGVSANAVTVAGFCIACLAAFHFAARHLETLADTTNIEDEQPVRPDGPLSLLKLQWHDVRELVYSAFPVVLLLGICAAPFAFHTSNQLFPNLARDIHHLREDSIARLVAMGRLPAMLTLVLMSPIIDRLNLVRFYGVFLFTDGLLIAAIALSHSTLVAGGAYLVFYLSHGLVWAFALPAINVCVRPRLRDSAFALTAMFEIVGVFLAGILHNRLIEAGFSLPYVFVVCGVVVGASGLLLLGYSFSGHAQRNGPANGS